MDRSRIDRRSILRGLSALGAIAATAPLARGRVRISGPPLRLGETGRRNLVLVQLSGGNDGLSMLVPFGDDIYHANRESIRVTADEVLRLDDYCGLHPNLKRLRSAYDEGQLAVVAGCGYPHPVRSHFKSLEIWHTGRETGRHSGQGWVGRLCETAWADDPTMELVVHVGESAPYSLYSAVRPAVSFSTPEGYRWVGSEPDLETYRGAGDRDARKAGDPSVVARLRGLLADAQDSSARIRRAWTTYRTDADYPPDEFGQSMKVVAALIDAGLGSRVFSVELTGFDTHESQRRRHDTLMLRLDQTLGAFYADIARSKAFDDTIVVVFSEFGRRVKENGSKGTDHGVAAPMLVLGSRVDGGIKGRQPSLAELDDGDLIHTTDFRSVYGTVVERWFGVRQETVLGERFPLLPLVKT